MNHIANIVDTLRYGGSVDSVQLGGLAEASQASPSITNWQMNFDGGTLSGSCQINSNEPIIGAGLLALSADGKTFYLGSYCSMSDGSDNSSDTVALPTASCGLFNPDTNGRTIMSVVYGEVKGSDGKLVPFSQQQNFDI
ncbi:MAG TPA: hypothetical protein VJT50_00425 [Pyrinomonadaceae bacterium]|nr:hypothetical protein [Pyrinomonadaceae bacterium]